MLTRLLFSPFHGTNKTVKQYNSTAQNSNSCRGGRMVIANFQSNERPVLTWNTSEIIRETMFNEQAIRCAWESVRPPSKVSSI